MSFFMVDCHKDMREWLLVAPKFFLEKVVGLPRCFYTKNDHQAFIARFDGKEFIATKLNPPSQVRHEYCARFLHDNEEKSPKVLLSKSNRDLFCLCQPPQRIYPILRVDIQRIEPV
jgi:hypothetical protein